MRSAPSLALDIAPSRIALASVGLIIVLALMSVWISAIGEVLQWLITLLLVLLALPALRQCRHPAVRRAVLQSDGVWLLLLANGERAAHLISASPLGAMTGLIWRDNDSGRSIAMMLWPDSIPFSARRQLRVWLRSGRAQAKQSAH